MGSMAKRCLFEEASTKYRRHAYQILRSTDCCRSCTDVVSQTSFAEPPAKVHANSFMSDARCRALSFKAWLMHPTLAMQSKGMLWTKCRKQPNLDMLLISS